MAPKQSPGAGSWRACQAHTHGLWSNLDERPLIYQAIYHADVPEDVDRLIAFFVSLRPTNDEQRHYLASARDIFGES